jgi:diaminopimelate epimerase
MGQKLNFTKMHGIGNDYIYFNCIEQNIENPSKLAIQLSNRHFGIGGDGIVLILPSKIADYKMRMFNADGSESEMCGNAVRCIAKFLYEKNLTAKEAINLETGAGIIILDLKIDKNNKVTEVKVDLGEPILTPSAIPVINESTPVINLPLTIKDTILYGTCVSMGNPHIVFFVDEITDQQIFEFGPLIEKYHLFPNRINVEFVKVLARDRVKMRVWERGSGETMACGTGAAAVCVASVLNNLTDRQITVELLGGNLKLEWSSQNNHVYKTGPATTVFEGVIEL